RAGGGQRDKEEGADEAGHDRGRSPGTTFPAPGRAIISADHGQFRCRWGRHERRRAIPRAAPILLEIAHSGCRAFGGHTRHIPILAGDRYPTISLVEYRNRRRGTRI